MNKKFHVFILLLFTVLTNEISAQNKSITCADLKNSITYFYPKNSADYYISINDGEFKHEINKKTGDTSLWQIKWNNDCTYTIKFVSSNSKISEENSVFLKKHKLVYVISSLTDEYYVFKGYVDNTSNLPIQSDTIWLSEKTNITNNELFKPVDNASINKLHFTDTSKYALLYIYRPKKFTNSLGNYIIYFDDNIMCLAKNNSGYVFKILKEGNFEIKSRLNKDESSIKADILFGKKYYVKSMIHWGIYSLSANYKLEMLSMNQSDGKSEFEEVNLE